MEFLKRLWNDEEGQGMVEYGLILALISIVAIVVLVNFGEPLRNIFQTALNGLTGAVEEGGDL